MKVFQPLDVYLLQVTYSLQQVSRIPLKVEILGKLLDNKNNFELLNALFK